MSPERPELITKDRHNATMGQRRQVACTPPENATIKKNKGSLPLLGNHKNMHTKYKLLAVLSLVVFVLPVAASAQTMTSAQMQAEIQQLLALVQSLQQKLAVAQGGSTATTAWCHVFSTNLEVGNTSPDITALQQALSKDGESVSVSGTFDEQTASAVTGFQQKYASQILTPSGLKNGTGYVGKATRTELNSLFGCNDHQTMPPVYNPTSTTTAPPISTSGSGSLNITLDPTIAAQSQTATPGATGYVFVVADLTAEGGPVTVSSLNFGCGGFACNAVTNLQMVGMGPNTQTWSGSVSNEQTFNPNLVIPAGTTQVVELIGNVSSNAPIGQQISYSLLSLLVNLQGGGTVKGGAQGSVLTVTTPGVTPNPSANIQVNGSGGPITVSSGAALNVAWSSVGVTSICGVSDSPNGTGETQGIGNGQSSGSATTNAATVSVPTAYQYVFSCNVPGSQGSVADSVQVNVTPSSVSTVPPAQTPAPTSTQPTSPTFTASPITVQSGNSADFSWSIPLSDIQGNNANASISFSCVPGVIMYDDEANTYLSCGQNYSVPYIIASQKYVQFQYVSSNSAPAQVTAQLSYNGTGSPLAVSVSVAPIAPSTVSVNINGSHGPLTIAPGTPLNVTIATNNISSCAEEANAISFGGGWSGWTSTVPASVTTVAPTSTGTYWYQILCLTPTGLEASDTVTVNVSPNAQ